MEKNFWKQQMAHEPTRLYFYKLQEIIYNYLLSLSKWKDECGNPEHLDDEIFLNVLEIGLDVGISARCFLEFPNIKLTSIDSGDIDIGIREIEAMNTKRWTFHHMTSDKYFAECKIEFDIIYVDGLHTYEQVKKDADNAWKFLKPDGIIIGHDIIHKGNFINDSDCGVAQAFAEFMNEKNVTGIIYPPHPGLIVITK